MHEEKELSSLVKWSQDSGATWLHMFLSVGFDDQHSFLFTQLRQHLGYMEWNKHKKDFYNVEELDTFAARKMHELERYDDALKKVEVIRAFVDNEKVTKEFLVTPSQNSAVHLFLVLSQR